MTTHEGDDNRDFRQQMMLAKIEALSAEIRRGVVSLANHPDVPDFFKDHPMVKQFIEFHVTENG
jgi:hypothetical protein